jgi:hypothetical protein
MGQHAVKITDEEGRDIRGGDEGAEAAEKGITFTHLILTSW